MEPVVPEFPGDPRLKLLIAHGGIGTTLEAAHHGVPVLGIPLQGDQVFNLRRLADRGLAEVLSVHDVANGALWLRATDMIRRHEE